VKKNLKMVEHDQLIQELYEDLKTLTTSQRLQKAGQRRSEQIKRWRDQDKKDREGGSKKKRIPKIRFNDNIILLEAAARNDIDEVRQLLLRGVDPNKGDEDGLTALHQSCIDDFEALVKVLIENGADVNAKDTENWTPLHAAATCGHTNICRILIQSGANILAVNADQSISFDICEENSECLFFLQSEMRRQGITQGDIDRARKSEEAKILADAQGAKGKGEDLNAKDNIGACLLHVAAASGYMELARYLLSVGVTVNIQDKDGWTPLHAASCWMQPEMVSLLSKVPDIDPFLKTRLDETALDLAEDNECKNILEKLEREKRGKGNRSRAPSRRSTRGGSVRLRAGQKGETPAKQIDMKNEKDGLTRGGTSLSPAEINPTLPSNGTSRSNEPIEDGRKTEVKESSGCCSVS